MRGDSEYLLGGRFRLQPVAVIRDRAIRWPPACRVHCRGERPESRFLSAQSTVGQSLPKDKRKEPRGEYEGYGTRGSEIGDDPPVHSEMAREHERNRDNAEIAPMNASQSAMKHGGGIVQTLTVVTGLRVPPVPRPRLPPAGEGPVGVRVVDEDLFHASGEAGLEAFVLPP